MSFDVPRYKKWRLCNRKIDIEIPSCVLCVKILDSFQAICNPESDDNDVTNEDVHNFSALSCNFCPNDSTIFSSVGVFQPYARLDNRDHDIPVPPCGFISIWDIEDYDDDCFDQHDLEGVACMFTYSPVPYPAFSSCGNFICSVMNSYQGNLSIIGYDYEEADGCDYKQFDGVALKCYGGNLCGKTFCCLINDNHAITITNTKDNGENFLQCELTVWKVVSRDLSLRCYWRRTLFGIFSELLGDDMDFLLPGLHITECHFSPDQQNIGILLSHPCPSFLLIGIEEKSGGVFIDLRSLLKITVSSTRFPSFCFHPLFKKRFIAFTRDNKCYSTDIFKPDTYQCILKVFEDEVPSIVNHVTYSRNGNYFSVTTATKGAVYVYNTKSTSSLLYKLIPDFASSLLQVNSPLEANSSQFSCTSEELVVAYNDGSIRVWQLPRILNLKELCRIRCLCLYERNVLEADTTIPKILKNYLCFVPQFD